MAAPSRSYTQGVDLGLEVTSHGAKPRRSCHGLSAVRRPPADDDRRTPYASWASHSCPRWSSSPGPQRFQVSQRRTLQGEWPTSNSPAEELGDPSGYRVGDEAGTLESRRGRGGDPLPLCSDPGFPQNGPGSLCALGCWPGLVPARAQRGCREAEGRWSPPLHRISL
jgi:hypothetical protein